MGLTAVISGAVNAAFNAVGDLKTDVTVVNVLSSPYTPATGTVADIVTDHKVTGLLVEYSAKEIAAGIAQVQDKKLIVKQADLGFAVKTTDRVEVAGTVWHVVGLPEATAHGIYTIQLRAPHAG